MESTDIERVLARRRCRVELGLGMELSLQREGIGSRIKAHRLRSSARRAQCGAEDRTRARETHEGAAPIRIVTAERRQARTILIGFRSLNESVKADISRSGYVGQEENKRGYRKPMADAPD